MTEHDEPQASEAAIAEPETARAEQATDGADQTVVAVRLRYNPKTFWFSPALGTYQTGEHVLVDTERGREIGLVLDGALTVSARQIQALSSPLKPVVRSLTDLDYDHIDALDAKGREALPVFRKMAERHGLDMKPVTVEFLFSGDKAVFYFSSDERVDFRELVRELAAHFHIRVDMRQIGVRDEARMLGGLSHCGEEMCCARMGGEFQPVSIRMAKEQDLPLNPAKISGACGRLMCCLRYEFEAYKDFKGRAPKKGAIIETPLGHAKVVDLDTPREVIHMRLEDGKSFGIPLREFDCPAGGEGCKRPCSIGREALENCSSSSIQLALTNLERDTQVLELSDPLVAGEARRPRRRGQGRGNDGGQQTASQASGQALRQMSRQPVRQPAPDRQAIAGQQPSKRAQQFDEQPTRRLRRSGRQRQAGSDEEAADVQSLAQQQGQVAERQRPGQRSSGLRGEREGQAQLRRESPRREAARRDQQRRDAAHRTPSGSEAVPVNSQRPDTQRPDGPEGDTSRRRRRRRSGSSEGGGALS